MSRLLPTLLLGCMVATAHLRAVEPQGSFYRGINLNGPPVTIDGRAWEGGAAKDFRCNGKSFENQQVALKPATDAERAKMLRSSRWGRDLSVELLNVPAGVYHLWLYIWEDNNGETFDLGINGKIVQRNVQSGSAGSWQKLGPFRAVAQRGALRVSAVGGDANLSGLEVWSLPRPQFVETPTDEQLAFFERRIRPLLVAHCYECHSTQAREIGGNLLLDSRPGIVKGGDTEPPVVPGDPEASLLMRAVRYADPDLQMPPDGKLSDLELGDLARWIEMRAPDPRLDDTPAAVRAKHDIDWNQARDWWSLRPLASPLPPVVRDAQWPRSDVDRFLLARMEAAGLTPAGDADRGTLLRRAYFDLVGLPPPPDELAAFLADDSPAAFAKVVDRLLESRRYGERWGRYWLDVVRYADTAGDNSDFPIPQHYRYRNWVIDAFNRDLPYDQFIREQLAGDLLGGDTHEVRAQRLIATGYIANARRFGSRVDDYPQHLTIEDTLDNVGRAFLATTINCARCHNHKFDPITTADYYALYGIFQSTRYPWPGIELDQRQRDLVPLASPEEVAKFHAEQQARQQQLDAAVQRLDKERNAAQGEARQELDQKIAEAKKLAEQNALQKPPYELAYAVAEAKRIEDSAVHLKGDPARLGPKVPRRFLTMLGGAALPAEDATSGRRQLAEWIVDPHNPLTARVIVNRIWLYHFGRGIVPTPNDFGRQGKPPTHPELLDWLAAKFLAEGGSIKRLHRTIMLSRAYQLSSRRGELALALDPENVWLSSYPRRRLDAEAIRDTLLLLGGNLDESPGGPHPFPPEKDWKFTQHNPFKAVYETNRRSVYLMTQRIQRHPYLAIFDGPDAAVSTPQRATSTTPLQALFLLNDEFVHRQAEGLAKRVLAATAEESSRIAAVYRLMFAREPTPEERELGAQFLVAARSKLTAAREPQDAVPEKSWQAYVRALLRLNEFVYVD